MPGLFICVLAAAMTGSRTASAEERFHSSSGQESVDEDVSMLAIKLELRKHTKCNEEVFEGLCMRTCTDMTQMEPRQSSTNCGGHRSPDFAQFCDRQGNVMYGFGGAPGTNGRKDGKCFASTKSKPQDELPNFPIFREATEHWECTKDPEGTPAEVAVDDQGLLSVKCTVDTKRREYTELVTKKTDQCRTLCDDPALMFDNVAYCCTENRRPNVEQMKTTRGSHKVKCICG